jgi:predicted HD phosphohydrolase
MTRFGPAVAEPVRHHVAVKRYLCRVDLGYLAQISPASVRSLELQGGPFAADEALRFETEPYYMEAVMVRRWDDEARVSGLSVPGLDEYPDLLRARRSTS